MNNHLAEYRVVYIDYDGWENSVFDSQVVSICKRLVENTQMFTYIGFNLPKRHGAQTKAKKERAENAMHGKTIWLTKLPYIGTINPFIHAILIAPIIVKFRNTPTLIFHCRGTISGRIGLFLKKIFFWRRIRVITDYRGVHSEHFQVYREAIRPTWAPVIQRLKIKSFHEQQIACTLGSDFKLAVTSALKSYYKLSPCTVIPCNYNNEIFYVNPPPVNQPVIINRLQHRKVFIYSGGLQEYQCISETLKIFKFFSQEYNSFMIFLTPDRNKATALFTASGVSASNYLVASVKPDQLRDYFYLADFAFILRHDNIVNKVASPVKIGEYLGCGLPLLYTRCTGDLNEINNLDPIGVDVELDKIGTEEYLRDIYRKTEDFSKSSSKNKINAIAQKYFLLESGIEKLLGIYSMLSK